MSFKFSQQAERQLEDIIQNNYQQFRFITEEKAIEQAKLVIEQAYNNAYELAQLLYGIVVHFETTNQNTNITVTQVSIHN
nr:MAG TPA: hypothetical protein [Bacteriophage sp.]